MKKLLITGGAGFIGSNFIRYILTNFEKDYIIVNLDKLTYAGNLDNLRDIENHENYTFVHGDICDKSLVDSLCSRIDIIINFAAETHVDRSIWNSESFIDTDVKGTHNLLEAAKRHKIEKYIQISTDEVYGSIDKGHFTEKSHLNPSSPYSASKASGDLIVMSYFKTFNLPAIITRSSNNYGPYQYPEKLIPFFITKCFANEPVPIYGDGSNIRDWIYVLDNCKAICKVLQQGEIGEIYNISSLHEKTNLEITDLILKYTNRTDSLKNYVKDRPAHDQRYAMKNNKVKKLGWDIEMDFEEGIKKTIDWYRNNQNWWLKLLDKKDNFKPFYEK